MDPQTHFNYFRMSKTRFDDLLQRLERFLHHEPTHRFPIPSRMRLAVTLRLLATGNSQQSVAHSFRMGKSTVNIIFRETISAIRIALQGEFLPLPSEDDLKKIAKDFWAYWNFPCCLGACDGKHIIINAPANSGSNFYNYKNSFSIVLMAIVDAKYLFRFVNIGRSGRESDAGVWGNWDVAEAFHSERLNLPVPTTLPGTDEKVPHVFIGDDAFPLRPYFMKPFSGTNLTDEKQIFNYRLSRARRIVENAFGILSARWRIFRRPIEFNADVVDSVVWACVLLHNYLKSTDNQSTPETRYCPSHFVDYEDQDGEFQAGGWRQITAEDAGMEDISNLSDTSCSKFAYKVRQKFMNFFNSDAGAVPWQRTVIQRGKELCLAAQSISSM